MSILSSSRPRSADQAPAFLPQLPLSARSSQRASTPPQKTSRDLQAIAREELMCHSQSSQENIVATSHIDESSCDPASNGNTPPSSTLVRAGQAGLKLPPLSLNLRGSRSHGDLPSLDSPEHTIIATFPLRNGVTPKQKSPSMWIDGRMSKSPSPPPMIGTSVSPLSRLESFNVPQHRLAIFDQHQSPSHLQNQLSRRPRSPADTGIHQQSMKNLLKASLTPKHSCDSFFGGTTVDAETVAIKVTSSGSSDFTESFHSTSIHPPSVSELMTMAPLERALSHHSLTDGDSISTMSMSQADESLKKFHMPTLSAPLICESSSIEIST